MSISRASHQPAVATAKAPSDQLLQLFNLRVLFTTHSPLINVMHVAEEDVPVRLIDNTAVLKNQLDRLQRLRANRDQARVAAALAALEQAAKGSDREPNLMDLAVEVGLGILITERQEWWVLPV